MAGNAVAISLQKGGVGKTSIAINLAERLAARDNEVILIDLDQQGTASAGLGLDDYYTADSHLKDVVYGDTDLDKLIQPAAGETQFDVIPGHRDLDELEDKLRTDSLGFLRLRRDVVEPLLEDGYDHVVIDNPPRINPLSDAATVAAQRIIVPLKMREQSVAGLRQLVSQQLAPLREELDVEIIAIVPNELSGDNEEREIIADLEASQWGAKLPSFARSDEWEDPESPGPGIRQDIDIARSWKEGVPLATYNPDNSTNLQRFAVLAGIVEDGGIEDAR